MGVDSIVCCLLQLSSTQSCWLVKNIVLNVVLLCQGLMDEGLIDDELMQQLQDAVRAERLDLFRRPRSVPFTLVLSVTFHE